MAAIDVDDFSQEKNVSMKAYAIPFGTMGRYFDISETESVLDLMTISGHLERKISKPIFTYLEYSRS